MVEGQNGLGDVLLKESFHNKAITSVVNSTISEWDIKAAHLVAIRIIYGDSDIYRNLCKINETSKLARNVEIGNMIKKDPSLGERIKGLVFKFKKQFIEENGIGLQNILETTKDSVMLSQKLPINTTIKVDGVEVEFRNKEGFYSSYYRVFGSENKTLLFDSETGNIRIKGINETTVNESTFVKEYLKPLLYDLELSTSMGPYVCMNSMKTQRDKYINSENLDIYKSLNNQNKFLYKVNEEIIATVIPVPNGNLLKVANYSDFVMPLMKTVL